MIEDKETFEDYQSNMIKENVWQEQSEYGEGIWDHLTTKYQAIIKEKEHNLKKEHDKTYLKNKDLIIGLKRELKEKDKKISELEFLQNQIENKKD